MDIYLSPISMLASYALEVSGDSILINGQPHALSDLAAIPEGEFMPPFVVSSTEGSVTLLLPYWGDAREIILYPQPLLDVPDGPVELPQ
jgi:hypothetical protein